MNTLQIGIQARFMAGPGLALTEGHEGCQRKGRAQLKVCTYPLSYLQFASRRCKPTEVPAAAVGLERIFMFRSQVNVEGTARVVERGGRGFRLCTSMYSHTIRLIKRLHKPLVLSMGL